jgi:hypothetical protein
MITIVDFEKMIIYKKIIIKLIKLLSFFYLFNNKVMINIKLLKFVRN